MGRSPSGHLLLRIGDISAESSLTVKTVRYYEDIGLLTPTVRRSEAGYRLFDARVLNRLAFIKRAQSLGLSLNEIRQILDVHDQGQMPCEDVRQHLEAKVQSINAQIEALVTLKSELQGILSGWQERPESHSASQTICPNLQPDG